MRSRNRFEFEPHNSGYRLPSAKMLLTPLDNDGRPFWTRVQLFSKLLQTTQASGQGQADLTPYVDRLWGSAASRTRSFGADLGARISKRIESRETEILTLIAKGLSNKEIARSLDIGPETVEVVPQKRFHQAGRGKARTTVSRAQTLALSPRSEAKPKHYFDTHDRTD